MGCREVCLLGRAVVNDRAKVLGVLEIWRDHPARWNMNVAIWFYLHAK